MNNGVDLLLFSALGLAGQVVAVGGALLAFQLGARAERGRRQAAAPGAAQPGATRPPAPDSAGDALDAKAVALLRQLRLPPVTNQEALLAWHSQLQLEGAALAADLPPDVQLSFQQALGAIRDILDTQSIDDRYELLAAALLPLYERLHAALEASRLEAPARAQTALSRLNRFTMTSQAASPPSGSRATYRETLAPASEQDRLASLFEQVEAAARARDALTINPSVPAQPLGEATRPGHDHPAISKADAEAAHQAPPQLDTSRLSRRLAEILKTADSHDHLGEPVAQSGRSPEPSAPDLHLVTPPLKSRLKRGGALTPEQEVSRKAAHVVGRAREWYGRPDITLREVQSACAAFGLEFNEVAARAELAKPLAEEAS
ncbi:MAG: hypothetical protein CFK52_02735 [Chloracidobacterium sp. CP2_5A]|nr:MAG: hypothetical protein CFK52_02735 [Chloracidobacterium sp. CP2_5A]